MNAEAWHVHVCHPLYTHRRLEAYRTHDSQEKSLKFLGCSHASAQSSLLCANMKWLSYYKLYRTATNCRTSFKLPKHDTVITQGEKKHQQSASQKTLMSTTSHKHILNQQQNNDIVKHRKLITHILSCMQQYNLTECLNKVVEKYV